MSVGEMSVGEMSVGEVSVGEMSVGEMSWILPVLHPAIPRGARPATAYWLVRDGSAASLSRERETGQHRPKQYKYCG